MGDIAGIPNGNEDDFDVGIESEDGAKLSTLERRLLNQIKETGVLPIPESEVEFTPNRRWRFDFAYLVDRLAIEVEGGTFARPLKCHRCGVMVKEKGKNGKLYPAYSAGRHNRGAGMAKDAEKYNEAVILGWRVIRVTSQMMARRKRGEPTKKYSMAIDQIARALGIPLPEDKDV